MVKIIIKKKWWEIVVIVLLILGSGAVIGTMNLGMVYGLEMVLGVGGFLWFRPRITKVQFRFVAFYVFYLTLHYLFFSDVTSSNNDTFIKEIMVFISLFLMSLSISKKRFLDLYINAMCIESIYTLILWMLNIVGIRPFLRVVSFTNLNYFMSGAFVYGFKNKLFPLSGFVLQNGVIRNAGIFWEPGAHQGFIVFAILLLIMNKKSIDKSKKKFLILLCTLVSTLSTTGLICAVLVMIMYYIEDSEGSHISRKQLVMFIIIIVISYFVLTSSAVVTKFTDSSQGSILVRSNDVISSISSIVDRPIFGYGEFSSYKTTLQNEKGVMYNSAGILIMMLDYGIPFGMYLVYRFVRFIYQSPYKRNILVAFTCIVVIICLFTEHFLSKQIVEFMMFTLASDAEEYIELKKIEG